MKFSISPSALLALIALLAPAGSALTQPATMTWPEAVARLTGERAKAETCVALVKRYGDDAQRARGQLTYTNAKADVDAVIAGSQSPVRFAPTDGKRFREYPDRLQDSLD